MWTDKVWTLNRFPERSGARTSSTPPPPHTRGLQAVNPASVWAPRFNGQPLGLILCCCKPITSTSVSGAQIEASIFVTLQARLEIMFESVLTAWLSLRLLTCFCLHYQCFVLKKQLAGQIISKSVEPFQNSVPSRKVPILVFHRTVYKDTLDALWTLCNPFL